MRKGLIFGLLVLGFTAVGIKVEAVSYRFIWTDTVVRIPVGGELNKYKDVPKAKLYRDDRALADASISYSREGDWLYFLKDVDTSRVGSYKVWYKAFETEKYKPGTCTDYKALITFVVYDSVKPTLNIHKELLFRQRGYMREATRDEIDADLMGNLTASDNYSAVKVTLNHAINYLLVGEYRVDIKVEDELGNFTNGYFYVIVHEPESPTISFLGEASTLKLPLYSDVDIKKYFKATDREKGDVSEYLIFPELRTDFIGSYNYTVSLKFDGLESSLTIKIIIVDDVEPVITLNQESVILDYKTDFNSFDFTRYIADITDNLPINYDNLAISHSLVNEVGVYEVRYTYNDSVYKVSATLTVNLVSKEKPVIEVMDIELMENNMMPLDGFINIVDESDPNIYETLVIDDSKVDYTSPGIYYASAYCINSSGLSETKQFKIIITKQIKEEEAKDNSLIILIGAIASLVFTLILLIVIYFIVRKKRKAI